MKRLKICSLVTVALMTASMTMQYNYPIVYAKEDSSLKVQMYNSNKENTTNSAGTQYKLTNTSNESIDLSEVKIRYYYTADNSVAENFYCDNAAVVSGYNYNSITDKVSGKSVKMDKVAENADHYLEISFSSAAGKLDAGEAVEIQGRFAKQDWSSFNQENDYSFNKNASSYVDWDKTVVMVGNSVVSGVTPTVKDTQEDPTTPDNPTTPDSPTNPTEGKVTVDEFNGATQSSSNTLSPNFKVTNTSSEAINLADLKLNYYYTSDGDQKENYYCDYAAVTSGTYRGLTDSIIGNIVDYNAEDKGANKRLEIGFASNAGTLEPGESLEVKSRIAKEDWSNFTQEGDYSFNGSASNYTSSEKVTAYLNGSLIWGQDPSESNSITPGTVSFEQGKAEAVQVNYSGKELSGIKNGNTSLVKDTDYTVSNGVVTLSKDYLNGLQIGQTNLTFDFAENNDPTFKITVTKPYVAPIVNKITPSSTEFEIGTAEDVKVEYSSTGSTLSGIKNGNTSLVKDKDYTVSNGTVTLFKDYLNGLKTGTTNLTFDFADGNDPTFKVIVDTPVPNQLKLEVGQVSAKQGETVKIPVNLSGITADGLESYEFLLKYDTSVLENVKVEIGESTPNASAFESEVNATTGEIKVKYLPMEDDASNKVVKDGVIAYITATVKADSKTGKSEITDLNKGEFLGWSDVTNNVIVYPVKGMNGSVNVAAPNQLNVEVGNVEAQPGETVKIPVNVSGLTADGLESYEFLLKYDTSVLENVKVEIGESTPNASAFESTVNETTGEINVRYLPMEDDASNKVLKDGAIAYVTGTVKADAKEGKSEIKDLNKGDFLGWSDATNNVIVYPVESTNGSVIVNVPVPDEIKLEVGNVEAKPGETVKIPVNVSGLNADGLESYEFLLKYDTTVLENVKVEIGESTPNASAFESTVNETTGEINVRYLPMEDDASNKVLKDGVIAYVTGTVKADAKEGKSEITDLNKGDFLGWSDTTNNVVVYPVERNNGSVTVEVPPVEKLKLEVGKAEGNHGDSVKIPVNVSNLTENGLESYEFLLKYDTSVLENVKVEIGESTPSASAFEATVNEATGEINVRYLPMDDDESNKVVKSGAIAYITGTIKKDAKVGESEVTDLNKGDFLGWSDATNDVIVYEVDRTNGSVTVKEDPIPEQLGLEIGKVEGNQGDSVKIPVNISKLTESGLESYEFLLKYDVSVLENVKVEIGESTPNASAFESTVNETTGEINVRYLPMDDDSSNKVVKDGVIAYITATIKSDAKTGESEIKDLNKGDFLGWSDATNDVIVYQVGRTNGSVTVSPAPDPIQTQLKLEVGNVEAKQGETVKIPVNISNLTTDGLESYEFLLKYDTSVLENVKVEIGENTPNASAFESTVNETTGEINVRYLPMDDDSSNKVVEDGVIAYVTATIKSDAKVGKSEVTDANKGDFLGWSDANNDVVIYEVEGVNGSVTVEEAPAPIEIVNKIEKDSVTFEEGKAENVDVAYTSTGSTLSGIKNGSTSLVNGKDYTESNGTVTLSKDYLNGLKAGEIDLTFDFAEGNDLTFKITVTEAQKPTQEGVVISTAAMTAKAGETIKVPVSYSGLPSDGLVATTVILKYDPNIFESVTITGGEMLLKASDNMSYVNKSKNEINITAAALDGKFMQTPGALVYLNLKVKDGVAPCTTKLTDAGDTIVADSNSKECKFSIELGDITIQ